MKPQLIIKEDDFIDETPKESYASMFRRAHFDRNVFPFIVQGVATGFFFAQAITAYLLGNYPIWHIALAFVGACVIFWHLLAWVVFIGMLIIRANN